MLKIFFEKMLQKNLTFSSYQDALNSKKTSGRKAKYYEPIQIGKYEKIKVMECNYDKKGYSPIEWTKKMEDNE